MEGTAAISPHGIVVPATRWATWTAPASGLASDVDPVDGAVQGAVDVARPAAAAAAAAATIVNDVALLATPDGVLHAVPIRDGRRVVAIDLGRSANGGVAVVGDPVVLGAGPPAFAPFITTGSDIVTLRLAEQGVGNHERSSAAPECRLCPVEPRHPVDPAAWWCRG